MGKSKPRSSYEMYKSIRRDWGGMNPVTRIKDSDKIYSRQKNKQESADFFEEYYLEEYFGDEEIQKEKN